jgi:hypothetical protein
LTAASASDPTQGFAASPEDGKTDPKDIPDPAAYDASEKLRKAAVSTTSKSADAEKTPQQSSAAKVPVENSAAASPPAAKPAATVSKEVHIVEVNPLLVAGLPLAAAALLMGVYWMILRAGAV